MEKTGWSNKQKTLAPSKGYHVLIVTNKCISVAPNIRVKMLENIYEVVCESKITCGIEVWILSEEWKESDKLHSRFFKNLMVQQLCGQCIF